MQFSYTSTVHLTMVQRDFSRNMFSEKVARKLSVNIAKVVLLENMVEFKC